MNTSICVKPFIPNSHISTLDLDKKYGLGKIVESIAKCEKNLGLWVEKSSSKRGYHVIIFCSKYCMLCRRNFDDPNRYVADITNRKPYQRDVLFNKKVRYYPEKGLKIVNKKDTCTDPEPAGTSKIRKVPNSLQISKV